MKKTALAAALMITLVVPAVRAEVPTVSVQALDLEVVPAEAAQAVATEIGAAAAEATEALPAPEPAAAAATTTPTPEPAPVAELPAEAPAAGEAPAAEEPVADMTQEGAAAAEAPAAEAVDAAPAMMPGKPPCPMHGKKGMPGMGMGPGGMKPGCDHRGKGMMMADRHQEVVDRLDMIEARLAKMEAMLESLMKREQ